MARLDDYQLVRVLAHGGMGVVHEAVERATGRRVALKRLLGPLDRDLVARLLVEGRALARLDHPAIVRVHALDEAPGGPFMVMDLVAGESLDRVLRREGPLAPERARAIVVTLTEALDHAHALGVLHRDLKPANVLVTPDDDVKLIDFGLAKLQVDGGSLGHLTRTGEMLGTPGYMAPEQADGRPVDARTDVYGLGATLYALLTGRAPFEGSNAIAILEGVLTREPLAPSRLRPGVPRALDEVVLACLAKDPAARPSTMSALRERLVGERRRRGPGRRPAPLALLATITVFGAAIAGAWWATRPTSRGVGGRPLPVAPVASSTTAAVDTRRSALEAAERAARSRPGDPEAWLDLARERARQGDVAGALAPPAPDAPRAAWIAHARALLSAGRLDDALDALPAGDDRELVLLRFQAVVAGCEGDSTRLAAARERPEVVALAGRVDQDPRWADGLFERERYLLLLSADQARAEGGAEALRALGAHVLAERLLAAAALPRGDPLEALRRLDAAIARSSGPTEVLSFERGHALVMAGRLADAEVELTRALELEPLSLRAWRDRSGCQMIQRRLREAAADAAQEVALLGPWASPAQRLRPAELLLAGGHVEAARLALEAVPSSAASAGLLRLRGDVLRTAGDLAGASRAYEQVLAGDLPGQASDFEHASRQLAALGHQAPSWSEAYVRSLRRVDDPSAWTTAALFLQGDAPELAEAVASRAIELGADVRAYVLRATVRGRLRRPWEALADHDQVVARTAEGSPDRLHAHRNRSATRATVGDLVGALQDLRAAGALDSTGRLAKEIERERERLERELAALAEAAAAATHAIRGTVQTKAALERLQAAAPYRAESTRVKLVYVWTLRAIGRALSDRRMVDTAERVLDDIERAGALPERAPALRRRFEQDEVDLGRAEGSDPAARVRGLLALRRYPEAVDALGQLAGHPSAFELELELARSLRAAGDLENARARYQRLEVDEGTDAWWEVVLGVAEVAHDTDQTTPELLEVLGDLAGRPGRHAGRAGIERARALLVVGRAGEALEAARRAEAHTEAALSATAPDDERARDALRGPLVEAALLRGRALLALERRQEARDALQGAALLASLLSLDDHHRLKAEVRDRALKAFPDDDALVRAAHLAFP